MLNYKIHTWENTVTELKDYKFNSEGSDPLSPQVLLSKFPQILLQVPEIDLSSREALFCCREFHTTSGPIDLLIITPDAEIVIVETKLLRNPESTRSVVAQVIDYIKSLCNTKFPDIEKELLRKATTQEFRDKVGADDYFRSDLQKSFRTGNFSVLIIGDHIHPNVLGMVESIQSAPHLAFNIQLVELNAFRFDNDHLVISPRIVANTFEVERSVISIVINPESTQVTIESTIPSIEGKGNKPKLDWDQFLEKITPPQFIPIIQGFKDQWILEIANSISMGQVGFSAGFIDGTKRKALQFVYPNRVALISSRYADSINIPDELYAKYKQEIKKSSTIFDSYLVGNRVEILFEKIDPGLLNLILTASLNLAKAMKTK